MKYFQYLILSSLCLTSGYINAETVTTAPKEQSSTAMQTYENKEKKYSIQYPAQWQKKDVPKLDLVLFAPPKNSSPIHASMNVVSEDVGAPVTLDQFYNESVSNLSQQLKEVNVETSGTSDLNGTPSKWVLYTHVMQGIKFRVFQYFIVNKNNVYLLTFSSVADDFASYRPDFEKIASTFRILSDQK